MSDNLNRAADELESAVQNASSEVKQAAASAADAAQDAGDAAKHAAEEAAKAAKSGVDDLVEGVERVSGQVADSARSVWESDQRKEVQDSVVKGLSGLASAIEEQTKKIAANPETQKVVTRIEEVTDKVVEQIRSSKTIQDMAEGVMKGLTALATSIEHWLGSQGDKPHEDASTDIVPIEDQRLEPPVLPSPPVNFDDTQTIDIDKQP